MTSRPKGRGTVWECGALFGAVSRAVGAISHAPLPGCSHPTGRTHLQPAMVPAPTRRSARLSGRPRSTGPMWKIYRPINFAGDIIKKITIGRDIPSFWQEMRVATGDVTTVIDMTNPRIADPLKSPEGAFPRWDHNPFNNRLTYYLDEDIPEPAPAPAAPALAVYPNPDLAWGFDPEPDPEQDRRPQSALEDPYYPAYESDFDSVASEPDRTREVDLPYIPELDE